MMTPLQEHALLDATAKSIEAELGAAYKKFLKLLDRGVPPRDAVTKVMMGFRGTYAAELAKGFSQILRESVGEKSVLGMNVAGLSLSKRLYLESQSASAVVAGIINRHAKGWQAARSLALQIYEGYGLKPREILSLTPRNAKLPKYLREELLADPGIQGALARHFARRQALSRKTPALKAAYLEYIDTIEQSAGRKFLEKKLKSALYERMRYFSNRIAQTELHRAYADMQAREVMADDKIQFVQYRMSGTHPRTDICDLWAKQDLYGLGPGIYPKAQCPKAPQHPHCRCACAPRLDIAEGTQHRKRPGAARAYLRSLSEREAAMVMGSSTKLRAVMYGADPLEVWNLNTDPLYKVRLVGEVAKGKGGPRPAPKRSGPGTSAAPSASSPAPQYWDPATEAGKWHEAAFKDAPVWIKEAIQRAGDPDQGVVYRLGGGAHYSPVLRQIHMDDYKPGKLKDNGVWRHEFGHHVDFELRRNGRGTSASDFSDAMRADATKIRRSALDLVRDKVREAVNEAFAEYQAQPPDERQDWLASKYATAGLDLDRVQKTCFENVVFARDLSGENLDIRYIRIIVAIEKKNAAEFLEAFYGANDLERGMNYYRGIAAGIPDLFGAATLEDVGFGHGKGYYATGGGRQQAEAFANIFSLAGAADTFFDKVLETFAPEMLRAAKRLR